MGEKNWIPCALEECLLVFFDVETTGLVFAEGHDVLEIGAVKIKSGEILDQFETLVKASIPVPPEAERLHGISTEMLEPAPPFAEVYPRFQDFVEDGILIAHNAEFDISFIGGKARRLDLPRLSNKVLDTLRISRAVGPDFPSHSLVGLRERFGVAPGRSHRALDDARILSQVFVHLARLAVPDPDGTLADLLKAHGPLLSFKPVARDGVLEVIQKAIRESCSVKIAYNSSSSGLDTRTIEPRSVTRTGDRAYVRAWCHDRKRELTFRADRIEAIEKA